MSTETLPCNIPIEGEFPTFGQVHRLFAATGHGEALKQRVRFERYKPSDFPNADWMKLLGADVNNLEHMPLTLGLSRGFLRHCETASPEQFPNINDYTFSLDEKVDIQLAAIVHDWGEAVVGDKMFDLKTANHEKEETTAMESILREILGHRISLRYRIEKVMDEVMNDRNSHTGCAFNAIERLGYMRTGLRAYEQSILVASNPELQTALQWCANNVLFNQVPALIDYSKVYPPVDTYISRNSARITEAFTIPESILNNYQGDEAVRNRNKYEKAVDAWQNYVSLPVMV